ncbi:MAG: rRNA maturation RNase YbeY [Rhodothermales bacterium]
MTLVDADGRPKETLDQVEVEVFVDHAHLSVSGDSVRAAVQQIIGKHVERGGDPFASVGIVLANRGAVHRLNKEFLSHDYPTDVISFRLTDSPPHEGEVYVDLDTANERYAEFGSTFEIEALRYVIHGTLHLTGMDDSLPELREAMRIAEDEILASLKT